MTAAKPPAVAAKPPLAPAKAKPFKVGSLADLKQVKKEIAAQAERAAQAAAQKALAAKRTREHRSLFQAAVGKVQRLP